MFISGRTFAILDPQQKYARARVDVSPGRRYDFIASKLCDEYPDQMKPFCIFDQSLQQEFNGTLFRFPLRTSELSKRSAISRDVHTGEDVLAMFKDFEKEACHTLLFLKNVNKITLYEWHDGENQPRQTFTIGIREIPDDHSAFEGSGRTAVANFVSNLQNSLQNSASDKSEDGVRRHISELFRALRAEEKLPVFFYTAKITSGSLNHDRTDTVTKTDEYIIGSGLYAGHVLEFAEQACFENINLKLLPWVGVAAKISSHGRFNIHKMFIVY